MEHERHPTNEQLKQDIAKELESHLDKVERSQEINAEHNREQQHEAAERAREVISKQPEEAPNLAEKTVREPPRVTKLDRFANYVFTLKSVQRSLPPVSRAFSKVIHNPIISKTSEIAEATVMRPSVALGATSTAAILGGFALIISRYYGYALPTSWFIACLAVGGALGLLIEGLTKIKKQ